MLIGYNLNLQNQFEQRYYEIGKEINNQNGETVYSNLKDLIAPDGDISGSKIQEEWFPQIDVDVFISHSHNDEEMALGLAGWLKENFGLSTFIDSTVWKSADALLKLIDEEYCRKGNHYIYETRNLSTSHVHMALAVSLAKMINRTEALFLLNTPNVIRTVDVIDKTDSPWIYFELVIAEMLREKDLLHKSAAVNESFQRLPISHEVNTQNLVQIDDNILEKWRMEGKSDLLIGLLGSPKSQKVEPLETLLKLVSK